MGAAYLEKKIIVAGERVTNANSGFDESGFAQVNITLGHARWSGDAKSNQWKYRTAFRSVVC